MLSLSFFYVIQQNIRPYRTPSGIINVNRIKKKKKKKKKQINAFWSFVLLLSPLYPSVSTATSLLAYS